MVDFDYDPDDLIEDSVEEELESAVEESEEVEEAESVIEGLEDAPEEGRGVLADSLIAGAIVGVAEEHGRETVKEEQAAQQVGEKRNVSPGAKPIARGLREETKKKKKLGPFEQWVADVIAGRKTMDDEL